jgi:hypothetical protein
MHLLVYGNLLKKSGDRKGRDLLETSMSYCEVGEAFANAAPVNDVELYKNCARAAAALERWDEMAYYNTKLADFEPEQGGRSRIGALAALSRMAAFRDPTCEEIPPYQSLSKRKSGVWFGGYPGARRGYPIDHFCIGWAYAQLGCEREATKELDQYLRSGHDLHEEEARTLRAELAQDRAPCLVPDAR